MAALAAMPIVFFAGIFATDAGTLEANLVGMAVLGVGGGASLWVFVCSVWQRSMAACLPPRPALRFALVQVPVYAAALGGAAAALAWALK